MDVSMNTEVEHQHQQTMQRGFTRELALTSADMVIWTVFDILGKCGIEQLVVVVAVQVKSEQ